jgi:hypothetical protein
MMWMIEIKDKLVLLVRRIRSCLLPIERANELAHLCFYETGKATLDRVTSNFSRFIAYTLKRQTTSHCFSKLADV